VGGGGHGYCWCLASSHTLPTGDYKARRGAAIVVSMGPGQWGGGGASRATSYCLNIHLKAERRHLQYFLDALLDAHQWSPSTVRVFRRMESITHTNTTHNWNFTVHLLQCRCCYRPCCLRCHQAALPAHSQLLWHSRWCLLALLAAALVSALLPSGQTSWRQYPPSLEPAVHEKNGVMSATKVSLLERQHRID